MSLERGRCVYISGLPYSFENSRILYLQYSVEYPRREGSASVVQFQLQCGSTCLCENGRFCVVNNTYARQKTVVYRGDGSSFPLEMEANEIKWYNI